jgi:hypothetical protein
VVHATPASGVFDEPVHIVITHVGADRELTVRLQSVDATGALFSAQAPFRSNGAARLISRPRRRVVGGSMRASIRWADRFDAARVRGNGAVPLERRAAATFRYHGE